MTFGIDYFARVWSRSESPGSIRLTSAFLLEVEGADLRSRQPVIRETGFIRYRVSLLKVDLRPETN
jgi:hypothetical protein